MTTRNNQNGKKQKWLLTREKVLFVSGLLLTFSSFINADIRGGTFHYEFLIGGLALCGISITQWGDKK